MLGVDYMGDIFKSKEVYKHVIKPGDIHQLIPVRGMYVANQWRSPYYIDHTISISAINCPPADIITYTETEVTVYEPEIVNPSLLITNNTISIVSYTKRSLTVYEPYEIVNPSFIVTNNSIDIYEYTHAYDDVYDNYDVCGCTFICVNDTVTVHDIITNHESEIDGYLQITNIVSNTATIT